MVDLQMQGFQRFSFDQPFWFVLKLAQSPCLMNVKYINYDCYFCGLILHLLNKQDIVLGIFAIIVCNAWLFQCTATLKFDLEFHAHTRCPLVGIHIKSSERPVVL